MPTDTAHVRIESRQYSIGKLDLGEGIPRRKLRVGAAIILPYWIFLAAIIHLSPLQGRNSVVYIIPAGVLVFLALRPDEGGRPRYVRTLDHGRFLLRRWSPMIASDLARTKPGKPFIVSARWTVPDLTTSRRLQKVQAEIDTEIQAGTFDNYLTPTEKRSAA